MTFLYSYLVKKKPKNIFVYKRFPTCLVKMSKLKLSKKIGKCLRKKALVEFLLLYSRDIKQCVQSIWNNF